MAAPLSPDQRRRSQGLSTPPQIVSIRNSRRSDPDDMSRRLDCPPPDRSVLLALVGILVYGSSNLSGWFAGQASAGPSESPASYFLGGGSSNVLTLMWRSGEARRVTFATRAAVAARRSRRISKCSNRPTRPSSNRANTASVWRLGLRIIAGGPFRVYLHPRFRRDEVVANNNALVDFDAGPNDRVVLQIAHRHKTIDFRHTKSV